MSYSWCLFPPRPQSQGKAPRGRGWSTDVPVLLLNQPWRRSARKDCLFPGKISRICSRLHGYTKIMNLPKLDFTYTFFTRKNVCYKLLFYHFNQHRILLINVSICHCYLLLRARKKKNKTKKQCISGQWGVPREYRRIAQSFDILKF